MKACSLKTKLISYGAIARGAMPQDFPLFGSSNSCNFHPRKWKALASDDSLWYGLFMKRWGEDSASFYAPQGTKTWKDVYIVQDRCDRYGVGLKIIREGSDYYLIHQGEIQRYLGGSSQRDGNGGQQQCLESGISDRILFLIGDLEVACADAKRIRM